ncbi:TPA: hypothetical protein ACIBAY_002302, partial [Salmonella enterica subsp. enterica serovar Typhimurium]
MLTKEILHRQKRHYTAPACGLWIDKIFQFSFSTKHQLGQRQYWWLHEESKVKRLKIITALFSFKDAQR